MASLITSRAILAILRLIHSSISGLVISATAWRMVSRDLSALPDEPLDILEEDAPSVARAKKIFDGHQVANLEHLQRS